MYLKYYEEKRRMVRKDVSLKERGGSNILKISLYMIKKLLKCTLENYKKSMENTEFVNHISVATMAILYCPSSPWLSQLFALSLPSM